MRWAHVLVGLLRWKRGLNLPEASGAQTSLVWFDDLVLVRAYTKAGLSSRKLSPWTW